MKSGCASYISKKFFIVKQQVWFVCFFLAGCESSCVSSRRFDVYRPGYRRKGRSRVCSYTIQRHWGYDGDQFWYTDRGNDVQHAVYRPELQPEPGHHRLVYAHGTNDAILVGNNTWGDSDR